MVQKTFYKRVGKKNCRIFTYRGIVLVLLSSHELEVKLKVEGAWLV